MINEPLVNISELFLSQARKDLDKKLFDKAANMILLVVTEFNDNVDVISFLSRNLEGLSPQRSFEFIQELKNEIFWLNSDVLETRSQHDKMHHFTAELIGLLLGYGSRLQKSNYYDEAVQYYREALELRPGDKQILNFIQGEMKSLFTVSLNGIKLDTNLIHDTLMATVPAAGKLVMNSGEKDTVSDNIIQSIIQSPDAPPDSSMTVSPMKHQKPSKTYHTRLFEIKLFPGKIAGKLTVQIRKDLLDK